MIKFVLDVAYEDHSTCENPDWVNWCKSVFAMFNYKPPPGLINGLMKKNNPQITDICLETNKIIEEAIRLKEKKHNDWVSRRDAGNLRAARERCVTRKRTWIGYFRSFFF